MSTIDGPRLLPSIPEEPTSLLGALEAVSPVLAAYVLAHEPPNPFDENHVISPVPPEIAEVYQRIWEQIDRDTNPAYRVFEDLGGPLPPPPEYVDPFDAPPPSDHSPFDPPSPVIEEYMGIRIDPEVPDWVRQSMKVAIKLHRQTGQTFFRNRTTPELSTIPNDLGRSVLINDGIVYVLATKTVRGDQVLGSGGYKKVKLAFGSDGNMYAVAAIKKFSHDDYLVCQKEFELLKRFRGKPGIAQIICTHMTQDKLYAIMKLYNQDLFSFVCQPEIPLSPLLTLQMSQGIAKGIGELHKRNLIHADLKSQNVLIEYLKDQKRLEAVITDLGAVRSDVDVPGVRPIGVKCRQLGTTEYLPPELLFAVGLQEIGHEARHAFQTFTTKGTDLWSLGAIIVEMLTGKPFWEHFPHEKFVAFAQRYSSHAEFISNLDQINCREEQIHIKLREAIQTANPGANPLVDQLVDLALSLLQYDRTQRPTIEEVQECLEALQQQQDRSNPF